MVAKTKTITLLTGTMLIAAAFAPVSAQAGFFDQLFGGGQPAPAYEAPQPTYDYGQPAMDNGGAVPSEHRAHRRRAAAVDEKPVLQKTTDLMHDKTLRPGDAVMMKTGMHVYAGRETSVHHASDFVPLDDAHHIKSNERMKLAALDATRNDPLANGQKPDTLASGRSASVGVPVSKGFMTTDVTGRRIRYVGP